MLKVCKLAFFVMAQLQKGHSDSNLSCGVYYARRPSVAS